MIFVFCKAFWLKTHRRYIKINYYYYHYSIPDVHQWYARDHLLTIQAICRWHHSLSQHKKPGWLRSTAKGLRVIGEVGEQMRNVIQSFEMRDYPRHSEKVPHHHTLHPEKSTSCQLTWHYHCGRSVIDTSQRQLARVTRCSPLSGGTLERLCSPLTNVHTNP